MLGLGRALQLIQEWTDTGRSGVETVGSVRAKLHAGYPIIIILDVLNDMLLSRVNDAREHVKHVINFAGTNMLTPQQFYNCRSQLQWDANLELEIIPTKREYKLGFETYVERIKAVSSVADVKKTTTRLIELYTNQFSGKVGLAGGAFEDASRSDSDVSFRPGGSLRGFNGYFTKMLRAASPGKYKPAVATNSLSLARFPHHWRERGVLAVFYRCGVVL